MGATNSQPASQPELIRERAAAEARLADAHARGEALRLVAPLAVCGALVFLAADLYRHDSPTHIHRRMLRKLRLCLPPQQLPAAPAQLLRVPQTPLRLCFLPALVLGPVGCGKSTLLAGLAREAASGPHPAPVVHVRLRLPCSASALGAEQLIEAVAATVYAQIGFPLRRSLLGAAFGRVTTRTRLVVALQGLFIACEQVQAERIAAGVPPLDAAPLLLFDDLQDLIKDAHLKAAVGDMMLSVLGTLVVSFGVDRRAVRAVVTGSSGEMGFAFSERSPARGGRWHSYDLGDPAPEEVVAALRGRGYSGEEAARMVALCGTRLRLLEGPLSSGPEGWSAAAFLRTTARCGEESFSKVFQQLEAQDAGALARVLDAAYAAGDAGNVALQPPLIMSLPAALRRRMDISPILFVTRTGTLSFQSELHRNAWAEVRDLYAAGAGKA